MDEIYDQVIVKEFEEALPKEAKNMWALVNVSNEGNGSLKLNDLLSKLMKVIISHVQEKGYVEIVNLSKGFVIESGKRVSNETIIKGYLIRVLCYRHASQVILRLYLKKIGNRVIVTLYGDIEEDTPWLTNVVNPNKLIMRRN